MDPFIDKLGIYKQQLQQKVAEVQRLKQQLQEEREHAAGGGSGAAGGAGNGPSTISKAQLETRYKNELAELQRRLTKFEQDLAASVERENRLDVAHRALQDDVVEHFAQLKHAVVRTSGKCKKLTQDKSELESENSMLRSQVSSLQEESAALLASIQNSSGNNSNFFAPAARSPAGDTSAITFTGSDVASSVDRSQQHDPRFFFGDGMPSPIGHQDGFIMEAQQVAMPAGVQQQLARLEAKVDMLARTFSTSAGATTTDRTSATYSKKRQRASATAIAATPSSLFANFPQHGMITTPATTLVAHATAAHHAPQQDHHDEYRENDLTLTSGLGPDNPKEQFNEVATAALLQQQRQQQQANAVSSDPKQNVAATAQATHQPHHERTPDGIPLVPTHTATGVPKKRGRKAANAALTAAQQQQQLKANATPSMPQGPLPGEATASGPPGVHFGEEDPINGFIQLRVKNERVELLERKLMQYFHNNPAAVAESILNHVALLARQSVQPQTHYLLDTAKYFCKLYGVFEVFIERITDKLHCSFVTPGAGATSDGSVGDEAAVELQQQLRFGIIWAVNSVAEDLLFFSLSFF